MIESLFAYRLKVSPRGKSVRLRVSLQSGLEVAIPRGYDEKKVPALLERRKEWIRNALDKVEAHRKFFEPERSWHLPLEIKLPAIGEIWHVRRKMTDGVGWVATREIQPGQVLVFGNVNDRAACKAALGRWLMRRAREHLVPRLRALAESGHFRLRSVLVKRQRTRWASCSKGGTVSLNAKLLFLRPAVVDYVLTHELCHLVEMNHSKRFWHLVGSHFPEWKIMDAELRDMWKAIPRWAGVGQELRKEPLA